MQADTVVGTRLFLVKVIAGAVLLAVLSLQESSRAAGNEGCVVADEFGFADPDFVWFVDPIGTTSLLAAASDAEQAQQAQFQQPLGQQLEASPPTPLPTAAQQANAQLNRPASAARIASLGGATTLPGTGVATGQDAVLRATTDAGDLLGRSPTVLNLGIQHRNPVVNDPRVRGSRVGSLAASGSYWVPARIDLDTAVSKIDSRLVDQMLVIPGPYSVLYGPEFQTVDVELLRAPRFGPEFETHGATSADYRTNGQQFYGRQSVWGGNDTWGFRAGYGHSIGNDYADGTGELILSSYNSRQADLALGAQLSENSAIDGSYLRQDQTNIELAGQAFDIDWLVMDGVEVTYAVNDQQRYDRLNLEAWYNRTRFEGSAGPSKWIQFPYFGFLNFSGTTDVDSTSTGYTTSLEWQGCNDERLIAGTDLRYVNQELNEITSGRSRDFEWTDANSPIPRSHSANPGLFVQASTDPHQETRATLGTRFDWNGTDIDENAAELASVGVQQRPAAWILGSSQFNQGELLGAGFITVEQSLENDWVSGFKIGYAERAPNLTERYAIEPFMFLIQNGLNTVTGNPELDKERRLQVDLTLAREESWYHVSGDLFYTWAFDYITFEAMSVVPAADVPEQVNLKYVNTDFATLWGGEGRFDVDFTPTITPFVTTRYVAGDDQTRNGSFATRQATGTAPSVEVPGLPRGSFSGLGGDATEPLPGILPLDTRVGVRWHAMGKKPDWEMELSTRLVSEQDRVATSLRESTTPGFETWDVRAHWRPRERLLLVGGIENFTDVLYREHLDFRSFDGPSVYRAGITYYSGVEWTY